MADIVARLKARAGCLAVWASRVEDIGDPVDDRIDIAIMGEAADEITRLRSSIAIKDRALREAHAQFQAIRQATLDGKVCDDVAWFSNIETLHDYCWDCEGRIEKLLGIEPVELASQALQSEGKSDG